MQTKPYSNIALFSILLIIISGTVFVVIGLLESEWLNLGIGTLMVVSGIFVVLKEKSRQ